MLPDDKNYSSVESENMTSDTDFMSYELMYCVLIYATQMEPAEGICSAE